MAKCGFCNKQISSDDFVGSKELDKCIVYLKKKIWMFCCPHCDSVLGISKFV